MKILIVAFIIFQIVHSRGDKFGPHFPQRTRSHEREILEPPEPRFRTSQEHRQRDYSNYDRIGRKEYDLPETFKAPPYEHPDYWKNKPDYSNRRTFFGDFVPRDTHEKPFQGLYQFMSSIFNGGDEITSDYPEPYHYNHNRGAPPFVTPVTKFPAPYRFSPTEPNYIPPPKPIRASVIKLETITRSPIYSSFEYETTPRYYPPVKTILNQVLIENSKAQQNLSWHRKEPKIPPFKPLPVLPKPEYVPPTTLKPTYEAFYNDQTSFEYFNKTDYKYPDSVQDQLPHLNLGDVRIPYVSEKSIPQIFNSPTTETQPPDFFFGPSDAAATTNNFGSIDIRNGFGNKRERPINFELGATTVKSFPGAVEKVKRPTFKYTKKLTAQLDRGPVERVTNLTVLGFSKLEKDNVNPYQQVNYLNVRDLINYQVSKLENNSQSVVSNHQVNNSSTRPVNLNDELSLDAKILKDTNWDGLTIAQTTVDVPRETTTIFQLVRRTESKPSKKAFWEIVEGQSTESPSSTEVTVTTTTTEQSRHQTTTEFFWPSEPEATETNEPATTEDPTTRLIPGKADRRSGNLHQEPVRPTEEAGNLETITPSERTTFKRRYSRRPKIINFTPYPTGEELQKKVATRNHFPKRQKPNITLAFGNKNVLKTPLNFGKDEVMKFSDEDLRKRRKIEKRRRVYKRVRLPTSERPVQEDSL